MSEMSKEDLDFLINKLFDEELMKGINKKEVLKNAEKRRRNNALYEAMCNSHSGFPER
ncbi:MAG: hypothetical protein ACI4I6_07695 [Hominimerdicola sp.]